MKYLRPDLFKKSVDSRIGEPLIFEERAKEVGMGDPHPFPVLVFHKSAEGVVVFVGRGDAVESVGVEE